MPDLTFLGTGGSFVSRSRACAGIYCEDKLMDCGFGVLTNIRRAEIPLESLTQVYITHTHSDHIGDFTGLIWAMALEGRRRRLEVVSSKATAVTLRRILKLQATPAEIVKFDIDYVDPAAVGVKFCRTIHAPTNYAYRLEVSGRVITYTGDTAPDSEVVKLAMGSDLLIHDSTYLASQEALGAITKHSSGRQAAIVARRAGVRKLAMTHLFPHNTDSDYAKELKEIQDVDFLVATDLLRINV